MICPEQQIELQSDCFYFCESRILCHLSIQMWLVLIFIVFGTVTGTGIYFYQDFRRKNELSQLAMAYHFAAIKHRLQKRKDDDHSPYIIHPVDVVQILAACGVTDINTLVAGVLHDTIEDTDTAPEEIENWFGKPVLDIVLECSDDKSLDKVQRKQLQIEHVKHVSEAAKLVKLADKYSNASSLLENPPSNWSKQEMVGYAIWCFAVVRQLAGLNSRFDILFSSLWNRLEEKFAITVPTNEKDLADALNKYYSAISQSE